MNCLVVIWTAGSAERGTTVMFLLATNIILLSTVLCLGEGDNPGAPPCGGYYGQHPAQRSRSLIRTFPDCDFYFDYYTSSSVRSLADCKRLCVASCRCQHYSYNYNQSSPFYHHCYLSYHCADPQPATDWISGPKVRGQTSPHLVTDNY